MERNKAIILLFILALISAYMLFIPAKSAENTSINLTTHEPFTADKVVETMFFIGIILSPLSFIIAVLALWVAWKNRRKVYQVN